VGSYGAGVVRHLARAAIPVLCVTEPSKADRRARGKDDPLDAVSAAQAALSGRRVRLAKDRRGQIESLRRLRTTRQSAVKARRAALGQLRNTIVAAPTRFAIPCASSPAWRSSAPWPPRGPRPPASAIRRSPPVSRCAASPGAS
jgi:hypothetical protein